MTSGLMAAWLKAPQGWLHLGADVSGGGQRVRERQPDGGSIAEGSSPTHSHRMFGAGFPVWGRVWRPIARPCRDGRDGGIHLVAGPNLELNFPGKDTDPVGQVADSERSCDNHKGEMVLGLNALDHVEHLSTGSRHRAPTPVRRRQ